jgi:hypothetical protein
MSDDQGEWLDVKACAARRGIQPGTWRAYVSRGQAPPPDDPDDADPTRPVSHRRPRWRPETVDGYKYPGRGARTDVAERRRAEAAGRRAELAAATATDGALEAWLAQHHRALLDAADTLVDQRDDLVAAAGDQGAELAGAIDAAGEAMTGRPSRRLAGAVSYALFLAPAAAELAAFRHLRAGYEQVRGRSQMRPESGNDT